MPRATLKSFPEYASSFVIEVMHAAAKFSARPRKLGRVFFN